MSNIDYTLIPFSYRFEKFYFLHNIKIMKIMEKWRDPDAYTVRGKL